MAIKPINFFEFRQNNKGVHKSNIIPFTSSDPKKESLPKIKIPTPQEQNPVSLPGVPHALATRIIDSANSCNQAIGEYLEGYLKHLSVKLKGVLPEPSTSANIGKTKVTTLIDSEQIFNKVAEYIKGAEKSIQIEMFEFQNLKIDKDIWPSKGAELVPGWDKQQQILDMLIQKKKANPEMKIQVILDVHKWYQDGFGQNIRHYSNMGMLRHLKDNNIDVVPYPKSHQGGTILQHVKFLAVDSKKVIIGGMNWGNHSPANHDACVAVETQPKYKNSEVDNIINEIFNKDWAFAWQRLGKTRFVSGPTNPDEQEKYKGLRKKIWPESVEYMKIVGNMYDIPKYKYRYISKKLDLPEVKPIENPAIKVITNNPREYSLIGDNGSESLGNYIKQKLVTATKLRAELFVLSHKEIVNKIIERHKEAQKGGRPFDVQIIIHPEIVDEFPYCRKARNALAEAGVPLRAYKCNEEIHQRMHSKWAVFDDKELLIGSANWSVVGLENNLTKGLRPDYPLTNNLLDNEMLEHKPKIDVLEKELGLRTLFDKNNKIDFPAMNKRRKELKSKLGLIQDQETINKIQIEDSEIKLNKKRINNIKELAGYYKLIKISQERKNTYKRGNHECAVVMESPKISATFLKQFKKDWEYSKPLIPDGYAVNKNDMDSSVSFAGKHLKDFVKAKEPRLDVLV